MIEDQKYGQWRRRAARAVTLAVSAFTTVLLAACGSSARAPYRSAAPSIPTPLATSIQTSAGTWATVAMGHLDEPLNTFWQLFFRPTGSASWSNQVKATAVATNGGLVLASPGGPGLLVGVRPTNLLTFSPLIYTSDAGRSWSTGLLADGLAARPDALAAASASRMLALVNDSLGSAGALEHRRPLSVADVCHHACARVHRRRTLVWSVHDHRGRLHDGNPARRCKL